MVESWLLRLRLALKVPDFQSFVLHSAPRVFSLGSTSPWQSCGQSVITLCISTEITCFVSGNTALIHFLFLLTRDNNSRFPKKQTLCWSTSPVPAEEKPDMGGAARISKGTAVASCYVLVFKREKISPPIITLTDCHSLLFSESQTVSPPLYANLHDSALMILFLNLIFNYVLHQI